MLPYNNSSNDGATTLSMKTHNIMTLDIIGSLVRLYITLLN